MRRLLDSPIPLTALLLGSALLVAGCGDGAPGASVEPADLVLYGGTIWTGNAEQPRASAVAIAGGRVLVVGADDEALLHRAPTSRVLDLDGAFVTPGISDNHTHFASAARFLEFNIMAVSSQDEMIERVRQVTQHLSPGEWITGGLWGAYDRWARGSAGDESRGPYEPDLRLVDELTPDHPIFLTKFNGSEYAANRAALDRAGLLSGAAPDGIELVRDASGEPTGILRGPGVEALFEPLIPEPSYTRRVQMTRNALAEMRRRGVTNFSDMSDDTQLEIFRELHAAGELTARVHFRYPLDRWPELAEQGIRIGSGDPWIRLGALKGHIDGIMGNSTARFFEPYQNDPSNRGRWRRLMVDENGQFAEGRFLQYMLDADRAGLQLSIHAIGDEANRLLLDYLEELERQNGKKDRRFRLVHAQVIAPDDFARLGELGVIAEVQPYHLSDDMRWMEQRIGAERCRGAYAFASIRDAGAILSFGSDWPGTAASEYPIDPLRGIYAAVTRQTLGGEPPEGWFPEQRISVGEALRAYTWGSSYANFEDDLKGTIEPGKLADLTVFDRDLLAVPPADLLEAEVLYTIVDGRIVFEAGDDS